MDENGFSLTVKDVDDLSAIKKQYNVPAELQSCHTAIVDGYVIEGHVPVEDVERLLREKPNIVGIGVGGMPIGSPGMEVEGAAPQPFDVVAFDKDGNTYVYASYGQ
ncbi:MAG: hypothetical protein HC806_07215 [Anaerolineae bacterium]|nr:hypothetical protein [Anaerolineae bacterium]